MAIPGAQFLDKIEEESSNSLQNSRVAPSIKETPAKHLDIYSMMLDSNLYNFNTGTSCSETKTHIASVSEINNVVRGITKEQTIKNDFFEPPCFMIHPDSCWKRQWDNLIALLVVMI